MKTLYETLEVAPTASFQEIRLAYKRLAQKHHPDKGGDTEAFQAIQQAYDILGDEVKRKAYDETGDIPGQPSLHSDALRMLEKVLEMALQKGSGDSIDLLAEMRKVLKDGVRGAQDALATTDKDIANLGKSLKRMKTGKVAQQLLQRMIEGRQAHRAQLEHQKLCLEKATELLADATFDTEGIDDPWKQQDPSEMLRMMKQEFLSNRRTKHSFYNPGN